MAAPEADGDQVPQARERVNRIITERQLLQIFKLGPDPRGRSPKGWPAPR